MSLNKSIQTAYGVNASYHKITSVIPHWQLNRAKVTISSFYNEQAKTDKANSLAERTYLAGDIALINTQGDFPFEDIIQNGEISRQKCYEKIKALDFWNGSIDV